MIAGIFNKDVFEVLTIFSISPGSKFTRKELKEKTLFNNVNLDKVINTLTNSNLVKKEKRFLSLNLDKTKSVIKLISDDYKELRELPLDVYLSIINIVSLLSKIKGINAYLFGSYAKLIYKDKSDIDIAVISDKINNKEKKDLENLIRKTEKRYKKTIEIHYFKKNFYKNKKDPLVNDILKNGVGLI